MKRGDVYLRELAEPRFKAARPLYSWETDPFLSEVFGSGPEAGAEAEMLAFVEEAPGPSAGAVVQCPRPVRSVADLSWKQSEQRDLDQAVNLWHAVLVPDLSSSKVGESVLSDRRAGRDTSLAAAILDCLGTKAASTSLLRARSLSKFAAWRTRLGLDNGAVLETDVCAYANELVAPTSIQSLLASLNFAGGVFGLKGASDAAASTRLR
eukprot:5705397-Amphidinium_carterae.1